MDIEDIEARLSELEQKHAALHARFVETIRTDGHALLEARAKIKSLEERVKDLDQVEAAAYAAYGKTHEAAKSGFDAMNEAVERATYFESLPTVKDYRKRNKQPPES